MGKNEDLADDLVGFTAALDLADEGQEHALVCTSTAGGDDAKAVAGFDTDGRVAEVDP